MITLITGGTGDGKTALAVKLMTTEYEGRPIFSMGIPDLNVPHEPTPPVSEWTEMRQSPEDPTIELAYFTFPENAVIFLDEGQRVFRPRHVSAKVPPEVQAFETHRHCGIDWVIITQYPQLLDANIRRLCKRHIHIHATPVGKYRLEWPLLGNPEDKASREIATRTRYSPPKEVFGLYKSAEVHTKSVRSIPKYVYVFFAALIAAVALAFYAYNAINTKLNGPPIGLDILKGGMASSSSKSSATGDKMTKAAFIAESIPRTDGLHHTAPRYDDITKPTDAPFPVACMQVSAWRDSPAKCRCIDQQGNNYHTTKAICLSIVQNGIFKDWESPAAADRRAQPSSQQPESVTKSPEKDPVAILGS